MPVSKSIRIFALATGLLVSVSAAASLFETSATAQTQDGDSLPIERTDPSATTAIYGDWTVNCSTVGESDAKRKICESVQIIRVRPSNQAIAKIAIGKLPEADEVTIVIQTLAGVWLRDPVVFAASAQEGAPSVEASYTRCLNGACFAEAVLPTSMISALIGAPDAASALMTYTGRQRTNLRIDVSLDGFAAALAAALEN